MVTKEKRFWDMEFQVAENFVEELNLRLKEGTAITAETLDGLDEGLLYCRPNYKPTSYTSGDVWQEIIENLENLISENEQRAYLERLEKEFKRNVRNLTIEKQFDDNIHINVVSYDTFKVSSGSIVIDYINEAYSHYFFLLMNVKERLEKLNGIGEVIIPHNYIYGDEASSKAAGEPHAEAVANSSTKENGEPQNKKKSRVADSYHIKTTKLRKNGAGEIEGQLMGLRKDLFNNCALEDGDDWKKLAWLLMGNNMKELNKPTGKLKLHLTSKFCCFIDRLRAHGLIGKYGEWVIASNWVDASSDTLKSTHFEGYEASDITECDGIIKRYFK